MGMFLFQGIVFTYFARRGYQKKAVFQEPVVKTCQKGKFVTYGYHSVQFLCIGLYFLRIFSRIRYQVKAKILDTGKEKVFCGLIPIQI